MRLTLHSSRRGPGTIEVYPIGRRPDRLPRSRHRPHVPGQARFVRRKGLRLHRLVPETAGHELVDPRSGTSVAVGYPLLAVLALAVWLGAGLPQPPLTAWTLALPLVCALYGLFPLIVDRRMHMTFEQPTVLLAGLVGGPLVGVLAGVAAGLGDVQAVWRRRSSFAGLAMLQGFAAGALGVAWQRGAVPLSHAVVLACLGCFVIGGLGLAVITLVRRCWSRARLERLLANDGAELLVAAPVLYLFAGSYPTSPAATSLAVISVLAAVGFAIWTLTTERARIEREREALLSDRLTGALSRAGFEDILAREHARIAHGEQPAGLLVCDLDHFGHFNERHGHLGGDEALRHVVARIQDAVRAMDSVARWGGEELCILVPRAGALPDVEELAERIRKSVAETPLQLSSESATVTVSVGATLVTDWVTAEQAFARADEALYLAKHTRNAVCVLPPRDPAPGQIPMRLADAAA